MVRKSCHKGTKMTCGPEYEQYVEKCKTQYGKKVEEMYLYKNGAIGAFLEDGKFRFLRGSDKSTLQSLRSMRGKKSKTGGSSKKHTSSKKSTKQITVGGAISLLNNFYKKQRKSASSSSKKSSKTSNKNSKKSNKNSKKN
jgi:hypothetical protein